MFKLKVLATLVALGPFAGHLCAQQAPISQPTIWSTQPDVAAFEKMENDRLAAAQRALDLVVTVKGARTVDNTLAPFDEAMKQLNAAADLAQVLEEVHPDATFRDHATAMFTKASAAQTAMSLDPQVYQALSSLDVSRADAASRYYVQHQMLEFRLAGVDKDAATRQRLKKLNDQLTDDQSMFERNIADDLKTIDVADASELEGLPQDYIDAHKPGADGRIQITTKYPDILPALKYAKNGALRRRLWIAFDTRAYPKNRDVLEDMRKTRYEIATLLGYPSWADYYAADKMILAGKNIGSFIQQLSGAARPSMDREMAMLLAAKQKTDPPAKEIWDYDRAYLAEMVRRSQYAFDSESVRPYLPYNEVKQGVFATAGTLFQVSFRQEQNAPSWDPAVETWDVIDHEKMIGRFYLDMHPRPGKYAHDEMAPLLDGVRGKQLPEAILICNFPAPAATNPALMDYDDVVTFFHEFGHLMHHILGGQQQWAGVSGISMEQDFVEAPSQMLEQWMHSPQVLASFAKNYLTGELIPAELVARMNRASAFGRATYVTQQIMYAAISYDMYKSNPQELDPDAVTRKDMSSYTPLKLTPESSSMYASFDHLAGYSSAYYTYMWDEVIAQDFFRQFDQENLLAGTTPMRYRHLVLEPGGSMPASDLVKNFLGRAQNMTALQNWMNEEFSSPPTGSNASSK